MQYKYFPHTPDETREMLQRCGLKSLDELYADVPPQLRLEGGYQLPPAMSEIELRRHFEQMGGKNRLLTVFAGAGCYDHYTPSVVPAVVSRSEFLTSYTPYQAEISQGTLHYIFEFQTMMSRLTGLPVSNASLYDGATATAEAAMMCVAAAKKAHTVLLSEAIDPKITRVVECYAHFHGITLRTIATDDGRTSKADLAAKIAQQGTLLHKQRDSRPRPAPHPRRMGSRRSHGRRPEPRPAHVVRRPVVRLHVRDRETNAQDAGPHSGADR